MSNILAFSNQKGGVGKTTSAVNVALSLAVSEIKTLLIDLDPQANATTGLSDLVVEEKNNIYSLWSHRSPSKTKETIIAFCSKKLQEDQDPDSPDAIQDLARTNAKSLQPEPDF